MPKLNGWWWRNELSPYPLLRRAPGCCRCRSPTKHRSFYRGVEHPGSQTFAVSARHAAAGKQGERRLFMRFGVGYERLVGEPRTTGRAGRRPRCGPPGSLLRSPFAGSLRLCSISGGRLCGFTGRRLRRLSGNFRRDLSGRTAGSPSVRRSFRAAVCAGCPAAAAKSDRRPAEDASPATCSRGSPTAPCKSVPYGFRLRGAAVWQPRLLRLPPPMR